MIQKEFFTSSLSHVYIYERDYITGQHVQIRFQDSARSTLKPADTLQGLSTYCPELLLKLAD